MIKDMENNPYQSDSDVEEYYQTAISNLQIHLYHKNLAQMVLRIRFKNI